MKTKQTAHHSESNKHEQQKNMSFLGNTDIVYWSDCERLCASECECECVEVIYQIIEYVPKNYAQFHTVVKFRVRS